MQHPRTAQEIALLTIPSSDSRFKARAEAYLARGADSPAELQDSLRCEFPNASVCDGIVDRGIQRWYAYRDGRWVGATHANGDGQAPDQAAG